MNENDTIDKPTDPKSIADLLAESPGSTVFARLDPYRGIQKNNPSDSMRISINVSRQDVFVIRAVLADYGGLYTALTLFTKHISEYVKLNNLSYSLAERQQLIEHIVERCTTSRPNDPQPEGHDGRATRRMGEDDTGTANQPAVVDGEQTQTASEGKVSGGQRSTVSKRNKKGGVV